MVQSEIKFHIFSLRQLIKVYPMTLQPTTLFDSTDVNAYWPVIFHYTRARTYTQTNTHTITYTQLFRTHKYTHTSWFSSPYFHDVMNTFTNAATRSCWHVVTGYFRLINVIYDLSKNGISSRHQPCDVYLFNFAIMRILKYISLTNFRVFGVVGASIARRSFAGLFFNTVSIRVGWISL